MWGHVQISSTTIGSFFTLFHIHIFMVVSGYLYANNTLTKENIGNKTIAAAWPYIIFSCLACAFNALESVITGKNIIKYLFLDIYKTITGYGIFALWYLPSYTIGVIVLYLITNKIRTVSPRRIFVLIIMFLCLLSSLQIKGMNNAVVVFPLVSIIRPMACVVFLYVGYELGKYSLLQKGLKQINILIGLLLLVFAFLLSQYFVNGETNFSTLTYGNFPLLYFLECAFCAVGFILFMCNFNRRIPFINWCGRNSLVLLITHMTLKITNLSQFIISIWIPSNNPFFGLACLPIVLAFEIPIVYILNSYLVYLIKCPIKNNQHLKKIKY